MYIKKLYPVLESWMEAPSVLKRRMFWSFQARIMRKEKAANAKAESLLKVLETDLGKADPFIQGVMNWCAAQIGIYDASLRKRCIALGEKLGLYKDYPVSKGCTSPYLPEWISFEVARHS
jgi:3-methyladenine DNA glycosylase AlkD